MDKIIQALAAIGVIGAFGFFHRLYRTLKSSYETKEQVLLEKASLAEKSLQMEIAFQAKLHEIEIEKKNIAIQELQNSNDRFNRLLEKRVTDVAVAVKYFLAYDIKDLEAKEKKLLNRYIDELEDIVSSGEYPSSALPLLVQLFVKFGNEEKAIFYQKKILENEPSNIEQLKHLSHICHVFAKYEEAIKYSQKILEIDPSHHQAVYEIAVCNQMIASSKPINSSEQKEYDNIALGFYKKCLEIEPHYLTAKIMMALPLYRLGIKSGCSDIVEKVEAKLRRGELVHREIYALACVFAQTGKELKSIEYLKLSISQSDSKNKILLINNLTTDPDLSPIKKLAEYKDFEKFINKLKEEHVG